MSKIENSLICLSRITTPLDMKDLCRTCLAYKGEMSTIFSDVSNERIDIKLMELSQLQFLRDDGLPSQICAQCIKQINEAIAFKQQVKQADDFLKCYNNKIDQDSIIADDDLILNDNESLEPIKDCKNDGKRKKKSSIPKSNIKVKGTRKKPKLNDQCLICNEFTNTLDNASEKCIKCRPKTNLNSLQDDESTQDNRLIIDIPSVEGHNLRPKITKPIENSTPDTKNEVNESVHKKDSASLTGQSVEICPLCLVSLNSDAEYLKHMKSVHQIKKPFICDYCETSYTGKSALEIHIRAKHTRERTYACDLCTKRFVEKRDLNRHKEKHLNKFVCEICEKVFSFRQSLNMHLRMHKRSGNHTCPECNLPFVDEYQLKRHTKVAHTGETHECHRCHKVFSHQTRLSKHMLCHKDMKERRLNCKYCPKKFNYLHHLKNHERIHTGSKPFLCSICGKGFAQSHNLTLHLKQHEDILPHECEFCNKQFAHHHRLKRHLMIHTGEKPFMCNICGKCYSENNTLKKHIKSHQPAFSKSISGVKYDGVAAGDADVFSCTQCDAILPSSQELNIHIASHSSKYICSLCNRGFSLLSLLESHLQTHSKNERAYVCKECGIGFIRLQHLRAHHKRSHLQLRPHICSYCSKSFCEQNELNIHLRRHTGEKPYECSFCNRAFVNSNSFKTHLRIHTGEKPYKCDICSRTFRISTTLLNHINTHTVEERRESELISCKNINSLNLSANKVKQEDSVVQTMNTSNVTLSNTTQNSDTVLSSELSTKNIIFVNENNEVTVVETIQNYTDFTNDNIYSTNDVETDNLIQNESNKRSDEINIPAFNVVQSQDGKFLLQLSENFRTVLDNDSKMTAENLSLGEQVQLSVEGTNFAETSSEHNISNNGRVIDINSYPNTSSEKLIDLKEYQLIHPTVQSIQNSNIELAESINLHPDKVSDSENSKSICFPHGATLVYTTQQCANLLSLVPDVDMSCQQ